MARATRKGVFRHSIESPRILRKIPKAMKELRDELLDFTDAFREMPPVFSKGIANNISTRGGSLGETWKANTKAYQERKQREGKGNVPLEYTKYLREQLLSGRGVKYRIRKRGMMWGTKKLPYARAVHFGGKPFFAISQKMADELQEIMDRHSVAKLDKATRVLEGANGK